MRLELALYFAMRFSREKGEWRIATSSKMKREREPRHRPTHVELITMMSTASLLRLGRTAAKRSVFSCNTSASSIACRSMSEKASSTTSSVRCVRVHMTDDGKLAVPTTLFFTLFIFSNHPLISVSLINCYIFSCPASMESMSS